MKSSLYLICLFFLVGIFFTESANAQTFSANQKESLKGLDAMLVVVDFAQDAVVTDGLNQEQLEIDIRRKVAAAGIRLMGEMEWSRSEGVPYLYVYLNTLRSELGFYAYRAEVKLNQEVILKRNRGLSQMASTWEAGTLGAVGHERISSLSAEILELVDVFIADYKDVN